MIGQTIDRYRIESKLGEGGMGVVYKARDTHLDRDVAVKILPADKVAEPTRKQRFIREARAASALNHPNIVTLHDVGSRDGLDFMVLEYVAGRPLNDLIPSGGMAVATVLDHAIQMADALAAAHGAGIFHRDLKPSNVMITPDGRAKILDFGLAKLAEPAGVSPDAPTVAAPLTEQGMVVGTVSYMAPEQAEGRPTDARSDIFSFGIVLYEMTTGRRPFDGRTPISILHDILHQEPTPPLEINSAIPPDLGRVILRCLRKEPARRFQTMADLKAALEDVAAESRSPPRATARATSPWMPLLVLLSLVAVAIAGFLAWTRPRPEASPTPLIATALTTFAGVERYPSFAPDGRQIAFSWNGLNGDNEDVYVQMIGSGTPLRLTSDPRSDFNPSWSPDGRWIAFLRGVPNMVTQNPYELLLIAPLGGPERKVTDVKVHNPSDVPPAYIAWCPDSTCLFITDATSDGRNALYTIAIDTGEKRPVTAPPAPALADSSPAISPDGRTLLFRRTLTWGIGEIHALPLDARLSPAGKSRMVIGTQLNAEHPVWLPGGNEFVVSAKAGLWRVSIDPANRPVRLPFVGEDGFLTAVSQRSGEPARMVYARSYVDLNLWRIDMTAPGGAVSVVPRPAISSTRLDIHGQLSPDGKRMAFTSTRSGEWEIWSSDPDGAAAVQLTSMKAHATGGPRWSPDGRWIVFGSNQSGDFELYAMPSTGGQPRRLTSHPGFDQGATFTADGRFIYFSSTRSGTYEIWKMPFPGGGEPVQITKRGGWYGVESPDRQSLYYTGIDAVNGVLWRVPLGGGEPVRVLDGLIWWGFVLVDSGIYYFDRPAAQARLRFFDFATRQSRTIAENLGDVRWVPTATRDGRTLYYSRVDSSTDDLMVVENFQ